MKRTPQGTPETCVDHVNGVRGATGAQSVTERQPLRAVFRSTRTTYHFHPSLVRFLPVTSPPRPPACWGNRSGTPRMHQYRPADWRGKVVVRPGEGSHLEHEFDDDDSTAHVHAQRQAAEAPQRVRFVLDVHHERGRSGAPKPQRIRRRDKSNSKPKKRRRSKEERGGSGSSHETREFLRCR